MAAEWRAGAAPPHGNPPWPLAACLRLAALPPPRAASVLRSAAFGAVSFSASALNCVFVTYYLELFTAAPRYAALTPAWFYAGQLVFM